MNVYILIGFISAFCIGVMVGRRQAAPARHADEDAADLRLAMADPGTALAAARDIEARARLAMSDRERSRGFARAARIRGLIREMGLPLDLDRPPPPSPMRPPPRPTKGNN